jgi:GMP synthase-like glutamine amidotransferase
VNDREPEWIPEEIDFLRRATEGGVPVLGICFGGQALSVALGGAVGPAEPISIGWHFVETKEPELVPPGPWLHFNFESFSVPAGAVRVARSPCGPGAFRMGPHLGLQFHPEVTSEIVDAWTEKEADRLSRKGVSAREIRTATADVSSAAAKAAWAMFDAWWELRARTLPLPQPRAGG